MTTSEKLQRLRRREGLTQEQFAEKIGVSRQALSKWESGDALPDAVNLLSISQIFGVSVDSPIKDKLGLDKPHGFPVKKLAFRIAGAWLVLIPCLITLGMAVYASATDAFWVIRSDGMRGNLMSMPLPDDGAQFSIKLYSGLFAFLFQENLWWFFGILVAVAAAGVIIFALPELKRLFSKRKRA